LGAARRLLWGAAADFPGRRAAHRERQMRKGERLGLIGLSLAVVMLAGCRIDTTDCGKYGPGETPNPEADKECVPFCNRLMTCGLVGADREDDCLAFCRSQYEANSTTTRSGCECVVNDSCRAATGSNAYQCPGAPIPPPDFHATSSTGGTTGSVVTTTTSTTTTTTGGGTTGGTGGSTGGTTGSTAQCSRNQDCAYNQDCVNGTCLSRCHASCECATGESCVEGYCEGSVPPPTSCQVDCECNAGQHCVNNVCE
jgi:hypothetical protein